MSPRLFIFIAILGFSACVTDGKSDVEKIQGTWKIDKAIRNGKITNSLEGLYFSFNGPASFDSNLLGDTASFSSRIENHKIIIHHELIRQFEIKELTDSIMKLYTEINDDELSIVLKK